jgi:chromosome segregation ATPase
MLIVSLTAEEAQILIESLESHITELSHEIADTDSKDYREKLKHKKSTLNKILQEIENLEEESDN